MPQQKKCMSNVSPLGEKLFAELKNALLRAQDKKINYALRITHYALKKISFLSLAGQTVIVNRAVLPTSDQSLSAPSQKKFPVTFLQSCSPLR